MIQVKDQQSEKADEVVDALRRIENGDPTASSDLLPLVYRELRELAAARLARESADQTLQPTALVHEVYLRLTKDGDVQKWNSRGHFFGAASTAMRRILIEQARRKRSIRGGGGHVRIPNIDVAEGITRSPEDLLDLHQALANLAKTFPRKAKLVELRFFAGLTNRQAADVLGISSSTADQDWRYARAWLKVAIDGNLHGSTDRSS